MQMPNVRLYTDEELTMLEEKIDIEREYRARYEEVKQQIVGLLEEFMEAYGGRIEIEDSYGAAAAVSALPEFYNNTLVMRLYEDVAIKDVEPCGWD